MKKSQLTLALLAITLAMVAPALAAAGDSCSDPVGTESGQVQGMADLATDTCVWRGLPFSAPPVGDRRWRAPGPTASWSGVRDASTFGDRCMQKGIMNVVDPGKEAGMSEDCLYLNVWRPRKSGTFPVMVWVHGGGYYGGAGSGYDGSHLAENGDLVVVTVNYRLNIFGFFAHPELREEDEHGSTGSYGTLDQVASLRWVHDNIANFGGDPNNVTIFGESAGGWSICTLVATPLADGLFHKAIVESGGCDTSRDLEAGYASASKAAKKIGCDFDDLDCLKNASTKKVMNRGIGDLISGIDAMPHHDGHALTGTPLSMIRAGNYNQVPLMAGYNRDEFANALKLLPNIYNTPKWSYEKKLVKTFGLSADEATVAAGLYPLAEFRDRPVVAYGRMFAVDAALACPTYLGLASAAKQLPDAYLYRFDYDDMRMGKSLGAFHAAEIPFVFGSGDAFGGLISNEGNEDAANELTRVIQGYWINFAKTGDPNGAGLPAWPALDPAAPELQVLDVDVRTEPAEAFAERCDFWDEYAREHGLLIDSLVNALSPL